MTAAFANEKLVIDLKAVLEDIYAIMEAGCSVAQTSQLVAIYKGMRDTDYGRRAKKDLEEDRRRAEQGAHAQEGAHA